MILKKTGGATSYYLVEVANPNQGIQPYQAECGDIIEALGMDFNEGCEFKALWRGAAARNLGKVKEGNEDAKYDIEKRVFYAQRSLACYLGHKVGLPPTTPPMPAPAPAMPAPWGSPDPVPAPLLRAPGVAMPQEAEKALEKVSKLLSTMQHKYNMEAMDVKQVHNALYDLARHL